MISLPELQRVTSSAAVWQRYDRAAKADLWSTALRTPAGVYLVDPIAADRVSLDEFVGDSRLVAVVVTNENHLRDALSFRAPLFARFPSVEANVATCDAPADLHVIDLPGAPAGEIALLTENGDLIIGDALINFEPYGFTFLPDKYCTNPRQMRESLRQLQFQEFERIFFAHGAPITSNAHQRLESLLASA